MKLHLLLDEGLDVRIEFRILADDGLVDGSVRVEDEFRRITLDRIGNCDVSLLITRIVDMEPRKFMLLDSVLPDLLGVIAVDAEYLDLALGILIELLHVRNALLAPVAPLTPEIEDDVPALVVD